MAKKRENKKGEIKEVVTNCDHFKEVVTNCDHLEKSKDNLSQHDIEELIITVRGEQVLIDQDIARLYGVTTKALNQQAKRNSARFPSNFRFELTEEERDEVVANCDHLKSLKFRPTLPYAFTEQGIAQLSSVVHSQEAIERSIVIMNAFVAMRRFIVQNAGVLMRIAHLERHQIETDEKIDLILDKMAEQSPKLLPEQIFQTGCVWDAWSYVSDLVRSAKNRIVLIDNFVDDRVLSLLDKRAKGVSATIHSRYNEQFQVDLNKHNEQYPTIDFVQLPHRNHDRFLIIDDKVFIMGASLKDMGAGLCAVTEMQASPETILGLLE
ncbi:MAG: ORF6N domain-containing protein [Prevotella sp.]|nr:ORF6N domain-containing protein [Prevotella sp.]